MVCKKSAANVLFDRILKFQTRKGEIYVENNGFYKKVESAAHQSKHKCSLARKPWHSDRLRSSDFCLGTFQFATKIAICSNCDFIVPSRYSANALNLHAGSLVCCCYEANILHTRWRSALKTNLRSFDKIWCRGSVCLYFVTLWKTSSTHSCRYLK